MSGITKNELCLGYLTRKCPYDVGCKDMDRSRCFPPVCGDMKIEDDKVICEATGEVVDPWEVCLKCNPKEHL